MELTSREKSELRKIYADYQNIRENKYEMFDTIEEKKDMLTEISINYEKVFPKLKEKGVGINGLPKHIYSKNQLQFIKDAEQTEFDVDYSYSGRGMFGDVCPCIRCDSHNDLKTKANTVMDSMGKGIVIYAQY
jgi:hypothetical protein